MLRIGKRIPGGHGLAGALLRRASVVELDWDVRSKSRFDATDSTGRALGVFLPRGSVVRGGDVLVAEDGSLVRVVAAAQAVLVVHAAPGGSTFDLMRAAYHLGNRHVALELQPDHLKLEPDHVLADLLRSMGLQVQELQAPFEPEGGAYAASTRAGQVHAGHSHAEHSHDQSHDHGHRHGD
jgi:urease accessory protein